MEDMMLGGQVRLAIDDDHSDSSSTQNSAGSAPTSGDSHQVTINL